MSWSEPGFGFFGKGFWGRRVLWDNIPVQQRTLDANHHLEQLLDAFGGELEAFLAQIGLLPQQRDPYLARGSEAEGEWFYVASTLRWTDEARGDVLRLIGEADYATLPRTGCTLLSFAVGTYTPCVGTDIGLPVEGAVSGDTGTLVGYDNTARTWWVRPDATADLFALAEAVHVISGGTGGGITTGPAPIPAPSAYLTDPDRYPWYPYSPIEDVARWWRASIPTVDQTTGAEDPAEYEVALVRTRNFDMPPLYDASRSLANEVWVQGGDLVLPFQYPAAWIVLGNAASDAGALGTGVPIGVADGTQAPPVALPGPQQRLQANVQDPVGPPWDTAGPRLVVDVPIHGGAPYLRLYDVPDSPAAETGVLYREDPMALLTLDLANPMGTVDYLAGTIALDLDNALGLYTVFGAPITAHWQARGYYLLFQPPRVLDVLARDYGFENDRNDPEERQRAAIAHLHHYYGCKAAPESYRIRGEISLFTVVPQALWRLCSADLAAALPADHVFLYGGTFYTDLDPRHIRFDDIRADEQYYDTFNHATPAPAPPEWLTLADRSLLCLDDAMADGMSVGQAFALDVTQGYLAPVSEVDPVWRTPAVVLASTALTAGEAAAMALTAGWRVNVRMMRCQAEAFSFTRGKFGLTEYDQAGGVRPAIGDPVFWIDYEDSPWNVSVPVPGFPDQDLGTWTIIIGVGLDDSTGLPLPGPTIGSDVAVYYYPEVDHGDCCFCRSYKLRVLIEPMPQAYAYYESDADILAAVERIKAKILGQLIPIHARVAEWVVTTEWTILMGSVQGGWTDTRVFGGDEFADLGPSGEVLVSLEQRGDIGAAPKKHTMALTDGAGAPLVPAVSTGPVPALPVADPTAWYPVVGFTALDITTAVESAAPQAWRATATATAGVTTGEVRWTFRVTRGTEP